MINTNIINRAPACFNHPALVGNFGSMDFQYVAVGRPDFSLIAPESKPIDWQALQRFGAKAALQIGQNKFLEVRALRGAFFKDYDRHNGIESAYSAGAFLFPADRPMIMGAFKCYREGDYQDNILNIRREELSVASIGKKGFLIVYNSGYDKCGVAKDASKIPFLSCLGIVYSYERGSDRLGQILASVDGVKKNSQYGVRQLFRNVFGSGDRPGKFEGQIRYFVPESVTVDYDGMVPLKKLNMLPHGSVVVGYNLQKSRYIEL